MPPRQLVRKTLHMALLMVLQLALVSDSAPYVVRRGLTHHMPALQLVRMTLHMALLMVLQMALVSDSAPHVVRHGLTH